VSLKNISYFKVASERFRCVKSFVCGANRLFWNIFDGNDRSQDKTNNLSPGGGNYLTYDMKKNNETADLEKLMRQ